MSGTAEPNEEDQRALATAFRAISEGEWVRHDVECLDSKTYMPIKKSFADRWQATRDAIQDDVVYVDPMTGMRMGPEFARRLYDDPKIRSAVEDLESAPEIPRPAYDVQAAKRATLPPPPKHGRQRAPVDRDAFAAKRDAKRRMRKASRRAQR